jgi:retron-type reverse transcriptase
MERTEGKKAGTPSPERRPHAAPHGETRLPPDNRKGRNGHSSPTEQRSWYRPSSTLLYPIAKKAWEAPQEVFTALHHDLNLSLRHKAFHLIRKDAAAGVDGMTAKEYPQGLRTRLQALLDRVHTGRYRAPPVRRVYIPKGDDSGETRAIGIPTLEDQILQRAVGRILEAIYEQDFMRCS